MRFMKSIMSAAMVALTALSTSALADTTQDLSSESVIETIKDRGAIKIGVSLFKPWSMRDKNGELIGFELDVGRKLAEDMGVEAEFVPTAWDGIIPALLSKKFDVIISGMTRTPQRNLTVNFSTPYALSGQRLLANKQLTEGMSLEDFNSPDITFSARRGTASATSAEQLFPKANLLQFDEDGAMIQEVLNGNAHATLVPDPTPAVEIRNHPEVLWTPFEDTYLAIGESFAYRKGDPDATNFFNNWIEIHMNNGWLKGRQDFWFRGFEWENQINN